MTRPCVAKTWQEDRQRPSGTNAHQRVAQVSRIMPSMTNTSR